MENYFVAAITTMAGVVTYLFKIVYANGEECRKDRRRLWEELSNIRATAMGCPSHQPGSPCPIVSLHSHVMEEGPNVKE